MFVKKSDTSSLWQQLRRLIYIKVIQKVQVAIFKMIETEYFNNGVKRLIS